MLEAVKQFQLAQRSNKGVMKVRKSRCRKIWAAATNYNMDANTMVIKVTPTKRGLTIPTGQLEVVLLLIICFDSV